MRAVDTNVLVRLLTQDDKAQAESAEEFVRGGAWVSHLVLAETAWVLRTLYGRDQKQVADAIEHLLTHEELSLQDADTVKTGLDRFRLLRGVGFTDCLVLEIARKAGHLPLATFDRAFSKLEGTIRL